MQLRSSRIIFCDSLVGGFVDGRRYERIGAVTVVVAWVRSLARAGLLRTTSSLMHCLLVVCVRRTGELNRGG